MLTRLITDYIANKGLIGLCSFNILLFVLAKIYYVWRNRVMQRHYAEMSHEEKARFHDARLAH